MSVLRPKLPRVLHTRHYRNLWLGQLVSQFGDRLHNVALMVLIYELTGSATAIGLLMLLETASVWMFGLWAGALVDRWDRRTAMIAADLIRGLLAGALPLLRLLLPQSLWPIYVTAFALDAVGTVFGPAKSAVIPTIVAPDDLLEANSLSQMTTMFTLTAGMAAGGLLVRSVGTDVAFYCNGLSFLISAAFIALLPQARPNTAAGGSSLLQEIREGCTYVFSQPTILFAVGVLGSVMLFGGAINALWVPFVNRALGLPAADFALLDAVGSLGMLAGAGLVARVLRRWPGRDVLTLALQLNGLCTVLLALLPVPLLAAATLFVNGLVAAAVNVIVPATLQRETEDRFRGRVFALVNVVMTGASAALILPAGWLADRFPVALVYCGAGLAIVLTGAVARRTVGFRQLA